VNLLMAIVVTAASIGGHRVYPIDFVGHLSSVGWWFLRFCCSAHFHSSGVRCPGKAPETRVGGLAQLAKHQLHQHPSPGGSKQPGTRHQFAIKTRYF
jgi:hypothetical protein